jgi:hypothetical protein
MENITHLEGEIWQDVKGSEGFYKVSNMGRVYSYKSNRLIGSKSGGNLNHKYWLTSQGSIHRLVALHFVPNPDPINKTDVDHINFNIDDNRAVNLRWVTKSENQLHSGKRLAEKRRGNLHWKKILTDEQCKEIFKLREQKIKYKDIAKMYGVKENTICSMVVRGRNHIKNIE